MQNSSEKRLDLVFEHIKSEDDKLVLYSSKGNIITVTLNRPKALNSLNEQMIDSLLENYDKINSHQAVWIQGTGGKALCAGGDVKILYQPNKTAQDRSRFFRNEFYLDYKFTIMKAHMISCWDGIIMGGGVGLTAFGSFVIATEKTIFAMPEAKIGFFTDVGVNYLFARMRSNLGYYLGITGMRLKGEEAFIAGLANYFIPSSKLPQVKQQIESLFATKDEIANSKQRIAQILSKYHSPSGKKTLDNQQKINQLFSLPSAQQIYIKSKSLSKDPFYEGITKLLEDQCPVSVCLIHRLITLAKKATVRQTFQRDLIVTQHMASNKDMWEGVRCLLFEKGTVPKWSCSSILDVTDETVEKFLVPIVNSIPLPK